QSATPTYRSSSTPRPGETNRWIDAGRLSCGEAELCLGPRLDERNRQYRNEKKDSRHERLPLRGLLFVDHEPGRVMCYPRPGYGGETDLIYMLPRCGLSQSFVGRTHLGYLDIRPS